MDLNYSQVNFVYSSMNIPAEKIQKYGDSQAVLPANPHILSSFPTSQNFGKGG